MVYSPTWAAKAPANTLSQARYQILQHAVQNILETEIAEETMAQLIDGMPLYRVGGNQGGHRVYRGHPMRDHTALCPALQSRLGFFAKTSRSQTSTLLLG